MPPIDTIEVTAHTFQMNTNIARAFEALPETVRLSAYIEFNERKKSDALAFALTFYFGWLGAHHFYLDRIGWGIAYLCTLGFLGIGVIIDCFLVWGYTKDYNDNLAISVVDRFKKSSDTLEN